MWGFAFSSHASANTKTAPSTTYSPATLKNAKMTPGIVCPNNTAIKFENDMTASAVMIYVFQSKIFAKKIINFGMFFFDLTIPIIKPLNFHTIDPNFR